MVRALTPRQASVLKLWIIPVRPLRIHYSFARGLQPTRSSGAGYFASWGGLH